MGAEKIKIEMKTFQTSVKRLSAGVSQASILWKDEKFSELSSSVSEVANQSKNIMVSADRCCSSIDKFEKIALDIF